MTTKFKIEKKNYDILKEIADEKDIEVNEIVYYLFDYVCDNKIYKTFEKGIKSAEEVEVESIFDNIIEWAEQCETNPSTIFDYMMEEVYEPKFKEFIKDI